MKKTIPVFQILMLVSAAATLGAKTPAVPEPGPETVVVPYDSGKPLEGQKLDRVYVPYERFVELWEAAKATRRGLPPEKLDAQFVLSSGRYDATLTETSLRVRGVIEMQTFGDGWVGVPLLFKDAKVGSLKLDGQPAPFADGKVAVEKAGRHTLEVEFEIPVKNSRERIAWGIPQTAGTLLTVQLPHATMKASVKPGFGVVERVEGGKKIVTAAIGPTERVELLIDSSVGLGTMAQPALAKIGARLNITPVVETVRAQFDFSFPESQQDRFTVALDKSLALVKLDVPNLKSWKLAVENDRQTLEIALTEPARGAFTFSIDAERTVGGQQRRFPFFSASANRVEQRAELYSAQELEVAAQPSAAFRRVETEGSGDAGLLSTAAFSSTGDKELLSYDVRPAKLTNRAEVSYVYQVNHSKIELIAALKLQAKGRPLFDVALSLPADFAVQAVEGARLKDWWRDGDTLHLRFKGATPEKTQLVLHLVKQFKAAPDALEITPINLPEPWEIEGNGIIAANKSVKAGMTVSGGKETDPQNAATDFRILPPMERKRGFSFKGRDFHASVKLETLPARITGTWIMSAQAHESWVSVSTHVNLEARQGSADAAVFKLPAAIPEARVSGANVRETTSRVEDGWRIYRTAFQNDLTDRTDFTVDVDLPSDGKVSLPAFEISGVERAEGFVIADNASEYEMQTQPSGLDVAQREQIPFLPSISRNARLFRAQPGWSLQITLTKLEKEAGRSAFVAWAEMTTAIRPDGSEWHRAVYHLQNRSLQFLPVRLPKGSELASVRVAGENVRADRGEVGGREVLLVPLIKTKAGDVSYDVELVYRRPARAGLFGFMRKSFEEPEAVGITVERTLWNLHVPGEHSASHFGGNMEEVLSEVNKTEKLTGMLDELKSLNRTIVSVRRDSAAAKNAEDNFKKLAKSLEENAAVVSASDRYDDAEKTDNGVQLKQKSYVSDKKREIQEELERQKTILKGNVFKSADAPAQQSAEPQSSVQHGQIRQVWAYNGSYSAKPGDAVDADKDLDQKKADGQQLYVNDYVMNVTQGEEARAVKTPPSPPVGLVISGWGAGGGGGKSAGAAGGAVRDRISEIQSEQSASGISDTRVLDKSKPAAGESRGVHVESGFFGLAAGPRGATPKPTPAAEQKPAEKNVIVLNSARQNLSRDDSVKIDIGQNRTGGEQIAAREIRDRDNVVDSGADSALKLLGDIPAAPQPAEPKLSGAISLPVDFPTEGRVYHFKKLKANAGLTLVMTHPQSFERWGWLLVFLAVAAVAKTVSRLGGKKRLQTA